MSESWRGGSTRKWRKIREYVLIRDGYVCQVGMPGVCTGKADCAHHIYGREAYGDDPKYIVASCTACNSRIDPAKDNPKPKQMTEW